MASIRTYDFQVEHIGMLPREIFGYHYANYKSGQQAFEDWIRQASCYRQQELALNYLPILAKQLMEAKAFISEDALYNLKRWLAGRQVCYYDQLLKEKADDAHLRPIAVALELLHVLRPEQSTKIIAECTPVNLQALVKQEGSPLAREMYKDAKGVIHYGDTFDMSRRSSRDSSARPSPSEREMKQHRMSTCSWRRSSDATLPCEELSRGRTSSRSTSFSNSSTFSWRSGNTSLASTRSWRSTSSSSSISSLEADNASTLLTPSWSQHSRSSGVHHNHC